MTKQFNALLSFDGNIEIKGKQLHIKEFLNQNLLKDRGENRVIECCPKANNIKKFKEDLNSFKQSWLYFLNINERPDWRTFWEIGYIFGISQNQYIISLPLKSSSLSEKSSFSEKFSLSEKLLEEKIPEEIVDMLETVPLNYRDFRRKIETKLNTRIPADTYYDDWDDLHERSKDEDK